MNRNHKQHQAQKLLGGLGWFYCFASLLNCSIHSQSSSLADFMPSGETFDMFDGESLGFWQADPSTSPGEIEIKDKVLVLHKGNPFTRLNWTGLMPTCNYEVDFDAKRSEGNDLFCRLVFPAGDAFALLVLSGRTELTGGIFSVDDQELAEYRSADPIKFENEHWYHIRLRVTEQNILVWVADQKIADLDIIAQQLPRRQQVPLDYSLTLVTHNAAGSFKNITLTIL